MNKYAAIIYRIADDLNYSTWTYLYSINRPFTIQRISLEDYKYGGSPVNDNYTRIQIC